MADRVTIASGALTAVIDPLGAELVSLTDADGRELMTNADPAYWGGHAPLLFPIVGALSDDTLRVDGRAYAMGKHGFARRATFGVAEARADAAVFTLAASEETRAAYPFDFVLTVTYRLAGATLAIEVDVTNPDPARALPASFGFHPAFAWPLPYGRDRGDHRIDFAREEDEGIRLLADDGTILPERRPSPVDGRTLHLADHLFADDALIWDDQRSDHVIYGAGDGPRLRVDFPDTPMLGIWTKPGAAFVCIEPWHGIADPHGYTGEFRNKPGVFSVAPDSTKRIAMAVTLLP